MSLRGRCSSARSNLQLNGSVSSTRFRCLGGDCFVAALLATTLLKNNRQTRRRDRLSYSTDFFIRQMKRDLVKQFREFCIQHLIRSFKQQISTTSGCTTTEDQNVLDIIKISIMSETITEISTHALPDLERAFMT